MYRLPWVASARARSSEQSEPALERLGGGRLAEQAGADFPVIGHVRDRQMFVGAVPELRRDLVRARPGLESLLVFSAVKDEVLRPGKALGVAPDRRQPDVRLIDEVPEVTFPAAIIVAEEQ